MKEDWVEYTIEESCEIHDNLRKPINSKERKERISGKKSEELYPYYGATGQVGFIDDYLTDGDFVLVGEDAAPFLDYSKDVAYKISGKTWVNNHAHILKSKLNDDFLLHYLNNFNFNGYVSGTTRLKLTQGKLKQIPILLPPLVEQKAIVNKIEELFSSLDSGIADLKKAQDQLKIYRQAVLKKAFEGELTDTKISNGALPINWNWASIFDFLFDNKKGMATGPFGTALKKHEHKQEGVPVLGIENIGEGKFKMPNKIFVTPEKSIELKSFKVLENDIIISRSGTVGEICSIPKQMENSLISTNLIRVRLDLEKVLPKFFVYLFQGGNVREQVKELCKGSTRIFLNQTILKKLKLPLCSIDEQKEVIKEIESRLSVCDAVEQNIADSLEKAQALRQSILKKAFEGKLLSEEEIAACKQHPDYESASVLLEKIKAEKTKKK
ncbi:MAG: restriction endonuclease subunit S [Aestuariibaculum sp.]